MSLVRSLYRRGGPTIVFGGPSLTHVPARWLAGWQLRPPARRGDLEVLGAEPVGTVLLVDGLFGPSMAVTPMECHHLLERGWAVVGASSMGALRASELWSAGMIGIGDVYTLLRLGIIASDADVAVAYHPDTHEEVSAAMVHVRAVLGAMKPRARIDLESLENRARELHWLERSWRRLFHSWSEAGVDAAWLAEARALASDDMVHPKRRDARQAVRLLRSDIWTPHEHGKED